MNAEHFETAKRVGDVVSAGTVVGVVVGYVPTIAGIITIVYTLVRLYETKTIQRLLRRE